MAILAFVMWLIFFLGILEGPALIMGIIGLFIFVMITVEVQSARIERLIFDLEKVFGIELKGAKGP